jgi:hypothetical protein
MKHPSPPLPPVGLTLTCFPVPDFFLVVVAENNHTTVHPNRCGGMQMDRAAAGTTHINSGAFPGNPFEADLYSFPQSRFPTALAVNPPNTPASTLMAWQCAFSR